MTKSIMLEFSMLGEKIAIELDYSLSPKTVKAIIDILPITITLNRWGDELYSDEIPAEASEENGKSIVGLFDVAYWPEGSALCLFYGPTPISDNGQIKPYSVVNIIGKIMTKPANVKQFLQSVEMSHIKGKAPVILR